MPLVRVEIREGWSREEKARLLDAIHAAAVDALRIPYEDRMQILTEHAAEAFEFPPDKSGRFILVEVTMSGGWPIGTKRRLNRAVVTNLGRLGISPSDVLIILHPA
jgi:phenylpyruvate tautomerase PptA (4-oxalocrotonate tautomerase family)